jgi:hypothetical protein
MVHSQPHSKGWVRHLDFHFSKILVRCSRSFFTIVGWCQRRLNRKQGLRLCHLEVRFPILFWSIREDPIKSFYFHPHLAVLRCLFLSLWGHLCFQNKISETGKFSVSWWGSYNSSHGRRRKGKLIKCCAKALF